MQRTFRLPAALIAFALAGWVASAVAMRGMTSTDGPGPLASSQVRMIIAVLLTALVTCGGALAAATQIHYLHKGDAVYSQNGQVLYLAGADAMSCVLSRNNDGYSVVLGPRAVQVDKGDKTVFFRYVP